MKEAKKIRARWLTIRLTEDEQTKVNSYYRNTTCNSLSEYARELLLKIPVTCCYRNQSADDFLSDMILLKNELNAIGNNFNQLVKRLHTLEHIPEIKTWILLNETTRQTFMKKTEEIKQKLNQIYELWLQK